MIRENNTPGHLQYLLTNKVITLKEYFFRQGANQLNINTYKDM